MARRLGASPHYFRPPYKKRPLHFWAASYDPATRVQDCIPSPPREDIDHVPAWQPEQGVHRPGNHTRHGGCVSTPVFGAKPRSDGGLAKPWCNCTSNSWDSAAPPVPTGVSEPPDPLRCRPDEPSGPMQQCVEELTRIREELKRLGVEREQKRLEYQDAEIRYREAQKRLADALEKKVQVLQREIEVSREELRSQRPGDISSGEPQPLSAGSPPPAVPPAIEHVSPPPSGPPAVDPLRPWHPAPGPSGHN